MKTLLTIMAMACISYSFGQNFEAEKADTGTFKKPTVKVGGDFAIQFQGLSHSDDANNLIDLGKGFNLPTANLNLDVHLADGVKLNLVTYLSARHHNEAWVKGGYLEFNKLPFFKADWSNKLMNYLTITVGDMELNYGDAHFRRSDNGNVTRNPFVGNYVMDAFTTAPALEILFRNNGLIAMAGITTGILKQDLVTFNAKDSTYTAINSVDELAYYGKLGYDKKWKDNLRTRLTLSGYYCASNHNGSIYSGDRTGSRYYLIMNTKKYVATDVDIKSNHLSGNWNPGSTDKDLSLMINPFVKFKGIEFFGTYEYASATKTTGAELKFSQLAGELLYRFGGNEQFYAGARYNIVKGNTKSGTTETDQTVTRLQVGAGWFLLESTVLKVEYVKQNYDNFDDYGGKGEFSGLMVEAAISF